MPWTLNSKRIFVQKITAGTKSIIAKLQPLSGGTVYQSFGYETNKTKITGLIVGDIDKNAIEALTETGGTSVNLTAPEGSLGNFFVESVSADRLPAVDQTIRPDLACDAPVYNVEIELLKDV